MADRSKETFFSILYRLICLVEFGLCVYLCSFIYDKWNEMQWWKIAIIAICFVFQTIASYDGFVNGPDDKEGNGSK